MSFIIELHFHISCDEYVHNGMNATLDSILGNFFVKMDNYCAFKLFDYGCVLRRVYRFLCPKDIEDNV